MKLTLVIHSLSGGGAERVLVLLAQGFIDNGYQVTVITLSSLDTDFYSLPEGCSRIALEVLGCSKTPISAMRNNLNRLSKLRKAICSTQPDAVISFLTGVNILTILSLINTGYPVIVTEHCDPQLSNYGEIWEKLRRVTYPYAAKVVSVSQGVNDGFKWLPESKKLVIYNPFLRQEQQQNHFPIPQGANPDKQWIVSMGRLTYQKGFDILLSAFAEIAIHYPNWQLLILGEGTLRSELEKLRDDLGLSEQVVLTGAVKNPFHILKKAKLFVMSSRFEGFPMVHGEAMACGLPVIATDCPSGPREIIRDGIDGILVPNEDALILAKTMHHLMSDEKERQRLANFAPQVTERFSLEKIMESWKSLITEVRKKDSPLKINIKVLFS